MKGPWKVTSNLIGGRTLYLVCRIIDLNKVVHSGNREYYGGYVNSEKDAQTVAGQLNKEEGSR